MRITPKQEAYLYTIDKEIAEDTKIIRDYLDVTYAKALELLYQYGARPLINKGILAKSNDGIMQSELPL